MSENSILALLGLGVGTLLLSGLVLYILYVVAMFMIFSKAGVAGWKSIIPFYNVYTQFKFTWNTKMFWIFIGLSFLSGIMSSLGNEDSGSTVFKLLGALCSLAVTVIYILESYMLARAFGHGIPFTLGLIFFYNIFTLILGFGSSTYRGNPSTPSGSF
ncbi:MAG: DUF5684 domain-containing protein [Lachnospiraceae bacterium]|nr:DUF5684 domain-containing protein [Lachnospiraceae bacterium]